MAPRLQEAQFGPIEEEWPLALIQQPAKAIECAGKGQALAGCHWATEVQEVSEGKVWLVWAEAWA